MVTFNRKQRMRWRFVASASLAANLVAVVAWYFYHPIQRSAQAPAPSVQESVAQAPQTNTVVRRQFFSWSEVESEDYPTYIQNLRQIGCPEQTIRDIIIADVNALFARRRATELVTAEQQWWRSEPDSAVVQAANEKAAALEAERRTLLTSLLGIHWESNDMLNLPRPTRPGIVLDGPVLGSLPPETRAAIQEISLRSQERITAYAEQQLRLGRPLDNGELARLRQQSREELAQVLAPAQLEEYLLRYSQAGYELRNELSQLRYFNASPEEFRTMFRVNDNFKQQMDAIDVNAPGGPEAQKALEERRQSALRLALGEARFNEYRLLQEPLYRDAVAAAQQAGSPESALSLYQINAAAAAEQESINANPNLTTSQKNLSLKQLELEQMTAGVIATGQELPPMPPVAPPAQPRRTYVLRPGDNLAVVALIHGVPVAAIRQANPGLNPNQLRPGDSINLPPSFRVPITAP